MARKSARNTIDEGAEAEEAAAPIGLDVTQAQIDARIATCKMVIRNAIGDHSDPPTDGKVAKCLAEIDALSRIVPMTGESA